MRAMESCIADIRSWMISDRLLLNDEKTEMLLIGTQYQLNKFCPTLTRPQYSGTFEVILTEMS